MAASPTDSPATADLRRRVAEFIRVPNPAGFGPLALEVARFQAELIRPYARICAALGVRPAQLDDWRSIPPVPTLALKHQALCVEVASTVFRSSGTQAGGRSEHHQPWLELYELAVDLSFPGACLPGPAPIPMLSLVPPARELPDSSLSFMIDRVVRRWGTPESAWAVDAAGFDFEAARRWLERAAATHQPVLVLATAFALVALVDALEADGCRIQLPAGSLLFETGGYKGRSRELSPSELTREVESRLGIPPEAIVREYGMSELSSQLYASILGGGRPDRFVAPPWVRVQILDPTTLREVPAGTPGLVSIFDLANAGSVLHVLTEDLGRLDDAGLELLGRASDAELRGCSLTAEAMSAG